MTRPWFNFQGLNVLNYTAADQIKAWSASSVGFGTSSCPILRWSRPSILSFHSLGLTVLCVTTSQIWRWALSAKTSEKNVWTALMFFVTLFTAISKAPLYIFWSDLHCDGSKKRHAYLSFCVPDQCSWWIFLRSSLNYIIKNCFQGPFQRDILTHLREKLHQPLSSLITGLGDITYVTHSVPRVPEICFMSDDSSPESMSSWLDIMFTTDTASPLLRCEACQVLVHASKSLSLCLGELEML